MKNRTAKNETRRKKYKNLFKTIKLFKTITIQNKSWNIKIT